MESITVKYKVLDARAKVPAYATPGAAAADLCAVLDAPLTVAPMQRVLVPTGLAIELPGAHSVALVYARSVLSIKHGLCMANGVGVVDSDYRGELKDGMMVHVGHWMQMVPARIEKASGKDADVEMSFDGQIIHKPGDEGVVMYLEGGKLRVVGTIVLP